AYAGSDMDRHQAPPAILRRRAKRSIMAADDRISVVRAANWSMTWAARRSRCCSGWSRISTLSARARRRRARVDNSSGVICDARAVLVGWSVALAMVDSVAWVRPVAGVRDPRRAAISRLHCREL